VLHNAGSVTPLAFVDSLPPASVIDAVNLNLTSYFLLTTLIFQWLPSVLNGPSRPGGCLEATSTEPGARPQISSPLRVRLVNVSNMLSEELMPGTALYFMAEAARDTGMKSVACESSTLEHHIVSRAREQFAVEFPGGEAPKSRGVDIKTLSYSPGKL
jgi:hypothetical protein